MFTDKMSKGKKFRYEKWLTQVKSIMADKYGITLDQAIAILDTSGMATIRCLLSWVEADEFIGHYVSKTKGYTNTGIDKEGRAIGNCKNCGLHGVLITKHRCKTNSWETSMSYFLLHAVFMVAPANSDNPEDQRSTHMDSLIENVDLESAKKSFERHIKATYSPEEEIFGLSISNRTVHYKAGK